MSAIKAGLYSCLNNGVSKIFANSCSLQDGEHHFRRHCPRRQLLGASPRACHSSASFFLANHTPFALGKISTSANQAVVADNFISLYTEWRDSGPGTVMKVKNSMINVMSNESALCWLTSRISPQTACLQGWNWTNVYGFRLVEGGLENGQHGG